MYERRDIVSPPKKLAGASNMVQGFLVRVFNLDKPMGAYAPYTQPQRWPVSIGNVTLNVNNDGVNLLPLYSSPI